MNGTEVSLEQESEEEDKKSVPNSGNAPGSGKKACKKGTNRESRIMAEARERRDLEQKRIALEEEGIAIERTRSEKETERFEAIQPPTNRRLGIDEKIFILKREERLLDMEEKKQLFFMFGAL